MNTRRRRFLTTASAAMAAAAAAIITDAPHVIAQPKVRYGSVQFKTRAQPVRVYSVVPEG